MSFLRLAFTLLLFSCVAAMGVDSPWKFREVLVEVRNPDGTPAADVPVVLKGFNRESLGLDVKEADSKYWNFKTDAKGRFSVRFGEFRNWDYQQASGHDVPGWGNYHLVATKPGTAGGISPDLVNTASPLNPDDLRDGTQWMGKPSSPIVIQLKKGISVTGTVLDTAGKAMCGVSVGVYHDLGADTHTGRGGAVLFCSAKTDRNGHYRIEHVYPGVFCIGDPYEGGFLAPDEALEEYWIKTRVRGGEWQEKIIDEITPRAGEKEIRVDMMLAKNPPYRYYGKVMDDKGRPIADAGITLGVSWHWPERTYEDGHHWRGAYTDKKGRYELRVEFRFVTWFRVEAEGFATEEQWNGEGENAKAAPPGEYNFTLKKK